MRRISSKAANFKYLVSMTNMSITGQKKKGIDPSVPDFIPAVVKPALPQPVDPEDPLESEATDVIELDETMVIMPNDEPPAPGEGP